MTVLKCFLQVNYYANELWAKFLRQADIAKDDLFRSYIPKWVEVAMKKAAKIGHPSQVKISVIS
jgi:hypothetical protein